MLRSTLIALVLAASVAGAVAALTRQSQHAAEALESVRTVNGVQLDPGTTEAQALAFQSVSDPTGIPAVVAHPPDNAVIPHSFPPPRLQWTDEYASRVYEVQLDAGGTVFFRALTTRREVTPDPAAWDRVKGAVEPVTMRVRSALFSADGRITGDVGESSKTSFRIAPAADDPTGLILFGNKLRPPGKEVGDVPLLGMQLRVDALDLERMQRRVVFRSSYGPEPTRFHPKRAEEESKGGDSELTSTQCVSCHSASADGRYIATFSQAAEEAPPAFDAPNGFLTVLEMPARKVLWQLPHAFMPMFNPVRSNLLVFGRVDETIGIKDQQMVRHGDLEVLDIDTGQVKPVPGANLPDRVENFPFWSPDGELITFIRTQTGQMWHGAQGLIDIAVVPYSGGTGGEAVEVQGASQNGRSNVLPVYSTNGKWIVFTQTAKGFFSQETADLMIVSSEGGEARRMDCNSNQAESWHRFSPDGKWLAVVTNREDIKRPHIYLSRFDAEKGTCTPAIQMPVVAGPGAHTHAFSWTPRYDWIDDYELVP